MTWYIADFALDLRISEDEQEEERYFMVEQITFSGKTALRN
jgi:hypothetical protein